MSVQAKLSYPLLFPGGKPLLCALADRVSVSGQG